MTIYDPTIGAGFAKAKSYEKGVEINVGTYDAPVWQPIRRISNVVPSPTQSTTDAQTYDDLGAPNNEITGLGWGLSFNVQVNRHQITGEYLREVEKLLALSESIGPDAVGDFRWYDKPAIGAPNPHDARRGFGTVAPARQNTGPDGAIESLGITVAGQGAATKIVNPFVGWVGSGGQPAPIIHAITPAGEGAGEMVTITGSSLLGATGVTFDGKQATDFLVIDGRTLVAQLPVDDAGDVPVVVTTPAGAAQAFTYTRGV